MPSSTFLLHPLYLSCPRLPPFRARSQKFKAKGISSLKEESEGGEGRQGERERGERELLYANGLCEAMHRGARSRRGRRGDDGPGGVVSGVP